MSRELEPLRPTDPGAAPYSGEVSVPRPMSGVRIAPVRGGDDPPTVYRIPQRCTPDRRRAREATLELQRAIYVLQRDDLAGNPADGFRLPPYLSKLPAGDDFHGFRLARKLILGPALALQPAAVSVRNVFASRRPSAAYFRRLQLGMPRVDTESRWEKDTEFARLRLAGANPLQIQRRHESPPRLLAEAAERVLSANGSSLKAALDAGRLFETTYGHLQDSRVQMAATQKKHVIAAPTCLFWADHGGNLIPLAIQLRPSEFGANPVFTPLDDRGNWMLARAHAQAADGHYHEGVWHLLTTHLVSEAIVLCTKRQLHPEHPIAQLLEPHTEYNLAINHQARGHLLAPDGPIDTAMATGVGGLLDLARLAYQSWSFQDHVPRRDLERRGVAGGDIIRVYPYREAAEDLWDALHALVGDIVTIWYRGDGDVAGDHELQAWAREIAHPHGGAIPGFPASVTTREALIDLLAAVIYRMSVAHAAVNNGQFDNYGFVPNSPGQVRGPLPETIPQPSGGKNGMRAFWRAMPGQREAVHQIGMAFALSQPTRINLHGAGASPAFEPGSSPRSCEAFAVFRKRLDVIADRLEDRNRELAVPYTYLDPRNVACSTEL